MRIFLIYMCFLISVNCNSQGTQKGGPHGGDINTVGNYKIEFVSSFDRYYVYLFDMYMMPIAIKNLSGRVQVFYPNDISISHKLKPYGDYGFTCKAGQPNYSYCIVYLDMYGEEIKSSFYNYLIFAKVNRTKEKTFINYNY